MKGHQRKDPFAGEGFPKHGLFSMVDKLKYPLPKVFTEWGKYYATSVSKQMSNKQKNEKHLNNEIMFLVNMIFRCQNDEPIFQKDELPFHHVPPETTILANDHQRWRHA